MPQLVARILLAQAACLAAFGAVTHAKTRTLATHATLVYTPAQLEHCSQQHMHTARYLVVVQASMYVAKHTFAL